jgi:hypothetical protein
MLDFTKMSDGAAIAQVSHGTTLCLFKGTLCNVGGAFVLDMPQVNAESRM